MVSGNRDLLFLLRGRAVGRVRTTGQRLLCQVPGVFLGNSWRFLPRARVVARGRQWDDVHGKNRQSFALGLEPMVLAERLEDNFQILSRGVSLRSRNRDFSTGADRRIGPA